MLKLSDFKLWRKWKSECENSNTPKALEDRNRIKNIEKLLFDSIKELQSK